MVDLTLFEIHLDGAEFTANAPGSNASESTDRSASDATDEEGGSSVLPAVLALVVLVVLVLVVRRVVGGSDEPEE